MFSCTRQQEEALWLGGVWAGGLHPFGADLPTVPLGHGGSCRMKCLVEGGACVFPLVSFEEQGRPRRGTTFLSSPPASLLLATVTACIHGLNMVNRTETWQPPNGVGILLERRLLGAEWWVHR